jgi:hypothetical protein
MFEAKAVWRNKFPPRLNRKQAFFGIKAKRQIAASALRKK